MMLIIYYFPTDISVQSISGYDFPLFAADMQFFQYFFPGPWLPAYPLTTGYYPSPCPLPATPKNCKYAAISGKSAMKNCVSARKAANLHYERLNHMTKTDLCRP